MSSLPLISVIIPVYNAAPYLEQCINSVKEQTWPNIELIIVDDGSTDGSLAILSKFGGPNVKLIQQENSGASVARNIGLSKAKGTYIQFLDADDLLSADKIQAQMDVLLSYPGYLALCPTVYFDDGADPFKAPVNKEWFAEGSDDPVDFLIKLYAGCEGNYGGMIQPDAWLTPRSLIDKAGPWNPMRNPDDDGEFFCRVILASKGVKYNDKGTSYYRKFNQKTTWSSRNSYQNQAAVLQSWTLKSEHLKPFENLPGVRKALAFNFTELCYNNYPANPDLSRKAYEMATKYGGLSGPPYFGNTSFNKLRHALPWKLLLLLRHYYHSLTSN